MKRIAIVLAFLSSAALAQQPVKLFIKSPLGPAPRTTKAITERCPKSVTVTNKPDGAYVLDMDGYWIRFIGTRVTAIFFNEAGDYVATFKTRSPKELGEKVCQYIESHPPPTGSK